MAFIETMNWWTLLSISHPPHHLSLSISRLLVTNVPIHLLVPLHFFEWCPSTIKIDRKEQRGEEINMCSLIDLVSTQERLHWNIIWPSMLSSHFPGITQVHISLTPRHQPHAPTVLHPPGFNQNTDLSAITVFDCNRNGCLLTLTCVVQDFQQQKMRSNMLTWSFSTLPVYKAVYNIYLPFPASWRLMLFT